MALPGSPPAETASSRPAISPWIAWQTVAIFFLIYVLGFIDRVIPIYLVKEIRHSLDITDFQFSLMQGLAFALFYSVLGIPVGWLVDRAPRRRIMAWGITIWSIGTIGCGLARHYWQLLLGRVGLATGEATIAPTAYSMVSDLFPPQRLTLALSIVGTGAQVGTMLAAAVAGYVVSNAPEGGVDLGFLGHVQGWQLALLLVGVAGLLLAPLIYTVPEPMRRVKSATEADVIPFRDVFARLLAQRRFYLGHFVGFGFASMVGWSVILWAPTFFMRHHGWSIQQTALSIGSLTLLVGLPGTLIMGYVVDRWFARGRHDAHLVFYAGATLVSALLVAGMVQAESAMVSLACLGAFNFFCNFIGLSAAALQIVTPARMRGRVSAMFLLVYNIMGFGLSPMVVALMTDYVFRDDALVGYSILASVLACALPAVLMLLYAAPRMRTLAADATAP